MDRQIVYPGAIPLDTDILNVQRNMMVALGYAIQAVAGTSTVVDGLACNPTAPASLVVNIGQGSIIALETIDANAYGSLPLDSDPLMKMGINPFGSTSFTCAAPGTSGQSINYLIEAAFQESDGTSVVLPYYNASNPAQPYSGPTNSGAAQNTQRLQRVQLQLKAGTAATTGTQTTPGVDSGWVGLYVITVNYGQTQITSSSIVVHPTAPFIPAKLPQLRRKLFANLSLYVNSSTGNDSNNGFATTTAFASLQGAWNYIVGSLDLNGYSITVNVANGNYPALIAQGAVVGNTQGYSGVQFIGNTTTPTNVTITGTNAHCFFAGGGASYSIAGFSMSASGTYGGASASGIVPATGSVIAISGNVNFASCAGPHISAVQGGQIQSTTNYSISAGAAAHFDATGCGQIIFTGGTVTLSGTPAFSQSFAVASSLGLVQTTGMTFSGSATGQRYNAVLGGAINTNGGGASYFPGNSAGSSPTGYYA